MQIDGLQVSEGELQENTKTRCHQVFSKPGLIPSFHYNHEFPLLEILPFCGRFSILLDGSCVIFLAFGMVWSSGTNFQNI